MEVGARGIGEEAEKWRSLHFFTWGLLVSDHLSIGRCKEKKEGSKGGYSVMKNVKEGGTDVWLKRCERRNRQRQRPIETGRERHTWGYPLPFFYLAVCCEIVQKLSGHRLRLCWGGILTVHMGLSELTIIMGTTSLASAVQSIKGVLI